MHNEHTASQTSIHLMRINNTDYLSEKDDSDWLADGCADANKFFKGDRVTLPIGVNLTGFTTFWSGMVNGVSRTLPSTRGW